MQSFEGEGSSSEEGSSSSVTGNTSGKEYDKISIAIKSKYVYSDLDKAAFMVSYAGVSYIYSVSDFTPVENEADVKKFVFLLSKHETLLEADMGDMLISAYLKMKNGMIYKLPFKFVVSDGE